MSATKNANSLKTQPRTAIGAIDACALFNLLEEHCSGDETPYRRLLAEARQKLLSAEANAPALAAVLERIDDYCLVERADQGAGFIVGFETCRRLLLGELDLDALARPESND